MLRLSKDTGILQTKKKKYNLIMSSPSYLNLLMVKQCSRTKTLHTVTTRKEQYYLQTVVHRLANASSQKLYRLTMQLAGKCGPQLGTSHHSKVNIAKLMGGWADTYSPRVKKKSKRKKKRI